MYGIYTNIGPILMGSMLPYIAYMDPMGLDMRKKRGVYPQNNPTFPCSLETGDTRSKLLGTTWHKMKLIRILDVFPIDCTFDPCPMFFSSQISWNIVDINVMCGDGRSMAQPSVLEDHQESILVIRFVLFETILINDYQC